MRDLDARAFAALQVVQRACVADIELVRANAAKEEQHDTPADRLLNRRIAAEAIVLLKNETSVLPLSKDTIKTLAVIGPNAKTRWVPCTLPAVPPALNLTSQHGLGGRECIFDELVCISDHF